MATPYQVHNKLRTRTSSSSSSTNINNISILRDKPFYIWDKLQHRALYLETNGLCCFNHIIGLPQKDKQVHPLYDYEQLLYEKLFTTDKDIEQYAITNRPFGRKYPQEFTFKDKHLWVLKSTGLGITEFMLRIIAWLCTKDDQLKGSHACIVTGPRLELSITLMNRLKALFYGKLGVIFQNKETVLDLNGIRIEAFPSDHLDAMRGLANVSFILLDEGDFFKKGQQQDARDISERYIGKSNPFLVMASTPNKPDSLFDRIAKEPEADCIYHRVKLDYTYGLGKIYSKEEIDKAKQSPSFKQEYDLQFLGIQGNTFHELDIQRAVELSKKYDPNFVVHGAPLVLGLDPGWGSSAFGLVLLQVANGRIEVLMADEYERPKYTDMIEKITALLKGLNSSNLDPEALDSCKIYVDAANPEFITTLKELVGESTRWDYINDKIQYTKKHNLDLANYMTVIPVPFGSGGGKDMLMHCKELLEYERPIVAINPRFTKLITALRTATSDDLGKLDKEATSYDNIMDAFRLALKGVRIAVKKEIEV